MPETWSQNGRRLPLRWDSCWPAAVDCPAKVWRRKVNYLPKQENQHLRKNKSWTSLFGWGFKNWKEKCPYGILPVRAFPFKPVCLCGQIVKSARSESGSMVWMNWQSPKKGELWVRAPGLDWLVKAKEQSAVQRKSGFSRSDWLKNSFVYFSKG